VTVTWADLERIFGGKAQPSGPKALPRVCDDCGKPPGTVAMRSAYAVWCRECWAEGVLMYHRVVAGKRVARPRPVNRTGKLPLG
jgi:hypothetical protein